MKILSGEKATWWTVLLILWAIDAALFVWVNGMVSIAMETQAYLNMAEYNQMELRVIRDLPYRPGGKDYGFTEQWVDPWFKGKEQIGTAGFVVSKTLSGKDIPDSCDNCALASTTNLSVYKACVEACK